MRLAWRAAAWTVVLCCGCRTGTPSAEVPLPVAPAEAPTDLPAPPGEPSGAATEPVPTATEIADDEIPRFDAAELVARVADHGAAETLVGRTFEATGVVREFGVRLDAAGRPTATVSLSAAKDASDPFDLAELLCFVATGAPWDQTTPGVAATLRGVLRLDEQGTPRLEACEWAAAGGEPMPRLSAAELAAEFAADPVRTKAERQDRQTLVVGRLAALSDDPAAPIRFRLDAGDGRTVACQVADDAAAQFTELKPGQELAVLGRFDAGLAFEAEGFALSGTVRIDLVGP